MRWRNAEKFRVAVDNSWNCKVIEIISARMKTFSSLHKNTPPLEQSDYVQQLQKKIDDGTLPVLLMYSACWAIFAA